MEFRVLGPVEVHDEGQRRDIGPARRRAVLAVLALDAGRVITTGQLVSRVWGSDPPTSARNALHGHVMRLRAAIGDGSGSPARLARRAAGYVLEAGREQVDVCEFRRLAAAARSRADEPAAQLLRGALECWRGPALAGVASPWLDGMRDALEMERRTAVLDLNDIGLRQGRHGPLTAELAGQAEACPEDQRLVGQLMLALYRSGRLADALWWFDRTRRQLADELGADPEPRLRELHQQILRGDRSLDWPGPPGHGHELAGASGGRPLPRELPAAPELFVGRQAELSELDRLLDVTAGTVVISAIGGTAGIGKTALAAHWAHRAAARFPDGQLYASLRGFDPFGAPADPGEVIRAFLEALGVPAERLPRSPDAQAGLYRSLLAARQMLIMLDNAADEQQIRPLLPGSPGSLVLVTSRNQLAGLAAREGARLLSLDILTPAEARDLLTVRLGTHRAAAEPDAVGQITALCARLPLALAVAAARGAARPRLPLATLAAELRDASRRLDALDTGDPAASVRAVFSWSYAQLPLAAARMFRLLGLHPGPDISVPAAASLAGISQPRARRLLAELTRAHLIAEHLPGRYAFHDLLRAYAAEQARAIDSHPDRHQAIGRVLDYYLHTAAPSARTLVTSHELVVLAPSAPGVTPGQLGGYQQALAWVEAEHLVLLAAVTLAAESGFDTHAWQLPWAIGPFLQARGHYREWAATQRTALTAATRLGDIAAQALSTGILGMTCAVLGDYEQATGHFVRSLALYRQFGSRLGESKAHQGLCLAAERQGRYADALEHAEQTLSLCQEMGNKAAEANALNNIGWVHGLLGNYQQARAFCRRALTSNQESGHRRTEGNAWDSLGYAEHHLGNFAEAVTCYQRALSLAREFADRPTEANALIHLGDVHHAAREVSRARDAWQQALVILDDLNDARAGEIRSRLQGEVGKPAAAAAAT